VAAEKREKGTVETPFPFLCKPLKKAEFTGKLSVIEARKDAYELSNFILPEY
jgi:hypothetical protein